MPSAYVITPNYNGLKFLRDYFRSLLEQTYSDFRIIFIDNASSDGSVEFIKNDYREYVDERIVLLRMMRILVRSLKQSGDKTRHVRPSMQIYCLSQQ